MELRQKLIKLHYQAKSHFASVMAEAEEEESKELDYELLFSQSFFMGLVAGVVLEKRPVDSSKELLEQAVERMNEVAIKMQHKIDYKAMRDIVGQIQSDMSGVAPSFLNETGISMVLES